MVSDMDQLLAQRILHNGFNLAEENNVDPHGGSRPSASAFQVGRRRLNNLNSTLSLVWIGG